MEYRTLSIGQKRAYYAGRAACFNGIAICKETIAEYIEAWHYGWRIAKEECAQ